jgi:hypothetical protein
MIYGERGSPKLEGLLVQDIGGLHSTAYRPLDFGTFPEQSHDRSLSKSDFLRELLTNQSMIVINRFYEELFSICQNHMTCFFYKNNIMVFAHALPAQA